MDNDDMKKYLKGLLEELTEEAKLVRKDYQKNPSPPEMSGSVHHVHENSPMLKEKKDRLITFQSPPSKKDMDNKK